VRLALGAGWPLEPQLSAARALGEVDEHQSQHPARFVAHLVTQLAAQLSHLVYARSCNRPTSFVVLFGMVLSRVSIYRVSSAAMRLGGVYDESNHPTGLWRT
jgi:hypothetical protein